MSDPSKRARPNLAAYRTPEHLAKLRERRALKKQAQEAAQIASQATPASPASHEQPPERPTGCTGPPDRRS
jgi:hypothetical protein